MGIIVAVSRSEEHTFSKLQRERIRLLAGLGVDGDAHQGQTVKHRSRVRRDPTQPNLRQVHLIHVELYDALAAAGFVASPGELGENITTQGLPLLELPVGARLRVGAEAIIELTGLRNPCVQLDHFRPGLLGAVLTRNDRGEVVRKAGVMGVVIRGGELRPGDVIEVDLPPAPHRPLEVV
jgi:MOSC domain-containing protein YiiM